jgi:UDP-N-acetylmuramate: L-alanyl-gamma-D-glutamyl-meso-diaminopimelate ligase
MIPAQDAEIDDVIARGCWSDIQTIGANGQWSATKLVNDGSVFDVLLENEKVGQVKWDLIGDHNVHNALMTISAARHVGVAPELACEALQSFVNTKRRLEVKGEVSGITVYDDFAHHPTAIRLTLGGLRNKVGKQRILAVLEPRSATMKLGVHKTTLADSLAAADEVFMYQPNNIGWSVEEVANQCIQPHFVSDNIATLVDTIAANAQAGDHILVMSNGGFGGIHQKLLEVLAKHE